MSWRWRVVLVTIALSPEPGAARFWYLPRTTQHPSREDVRRTTTTHIEWPRQHPPSREDVRRTNTTHTRHSGKIGGAGHMYSARTVVSGSWSATREAELSWTREILQSSTFRSA